MYLHILKRDLKRKRTMNIILLIFVILAATFIASSANNMITVNSALDDYIEKAGVSDYWFASTNAADVERFREFAGENGYDYTISELIQIEPKNVLVEGKGLEYSNTLVLSTLGGFRIFDNRNEEITEVKDGEIWVTGVLFQSKENDFHEGGRIRISQGGVEKEFTLRGYTKDALFGSTMVGMTRLLISENDAKLFSGESFSVCSAVAVYTEDPEYRDKFNRLALSTVMSIDRSMFKMIYMMDILMAAILLVVSICLILISMVILRFIIHFTVTEEFREIGVMKAIGIRNGAIRGLYIAKYFAIAVVGTVTGLVLSVPFSKMMVGGISGKIILSGRDYFPVNIGAAILAGAAVVLFSWLCTGKIRRFSPIDAIRSGETGERFRKKSLLKLSKTRLAAVPFMAMNDIFSSVRSYVSMIIIFILGTLLVIIPVNTINTLRSDDLITTFNMVKSDHIVSQELLFHPNEDNVAKVYGQFDELGEMFADNGIEADIFQEIMFRSNLCKGDKTANSLSFQGWGGVTTEMYHYLEGTPPRNENEVALTYLTAEQIGAEIGDDVEITTGAVSRTYTVTALTQSMNNMGEGVRFYQDAELDFSCAAGSFGIQVNYRDDPDQRELARRKDLIEKLYPRSKIYTPGEYIGYMIGNDVTGSLESMEILILSIILGINALVAVLMVKSFIAREKGEIALLKAIGFGDGSLILIQTLRIGMVLLISVIVGVLLSSPLSSLIITPIFRMMGAYSIEYEIRVMQVYVVFPLCMLAATAFAAYLSARGLRKISSSDIANME